MNSNDPSPARAKWREESGGHVLELSGRWHRDEAVPEVEGEGSGKWPDAFETSALEAFDSTLPAFLLARLREVDAPEPAALPDGLPEQLRGLMELALAVPDASDARPKSASRSGLLRLAAVSARLWQVMRGLFEFTGETMLSLGRFLTGRATFRHKDFWVTLQECGVQALPIVSLISFLIGLILAFVGNVQLANFGASLFIADLVGLAMVREMGVVMTAIIMCGRTGAAFAAHLGSMKANEEIDALRTFGFNPFDFLVLPRVLALVLMMPLLTIYSNAIGILGGMLVAATVDIPPALFWAELLDALTPVNASLGVMKSVFFGVAIAICGCMNGMRAGNSSAAVGEATTWAVVSSITAVIVLDSAFAAIFALLEI
jgi:phospholipid/cholesterol/gamma-HCH transport system permease protein